ncbi:MAG: cation:proton antiporter [Candidatus Nanohaloarchaea archaeon]
MAAVSGAETFVVAIIVAAVLGIVARKTRQPTLTAYIVTGMVLGPVGLAIVQKTPSTELLSELGLAFLLFLIGLEMKLDEIREIFRPVALIAAGQMALVAAVAYFTAQFLGFSLIESLFIAGASMYSSTAVVVKLLADKDEISTLPGKMDVGILLVEDLVVVVLMAILATGATTLSGIAIGLLEVAAVVTVIGGLSYLSSRYFLPRLFREISSNEHAFFVHGVAWAFLLISAAGKLGISMEIGAFIAGISLAQIPYSHELQERVRPLTDFLMAVFFINIGLSITGSAFSSYWVEAVIASIVFMAAKIGILFFLVDQAKFTPETSLKASLNKSQISEFALIFGAVGVSSGFISQEVLGFLSLVAIITMGGSSYLITYNEEIYRRLKPLLARIDSEEKSDVDVRHLEDHVVVAGYDEMARRSLSILEEEYDQIVVVDNDPSNTQKLSGSSYEYVYGDFRHGEIRKAANLKKADFVLCVASDHEVNLHILEDAPRDTTVFARAESMAQAAELYDMGAHYVIQKNVLTGDKMSEYVKLYLEDRDLFLEEVERDVERIEWGGNSD